jgi:heme-degrading monooxygenase HmoA
VVNDCVWLFKEARGCLSMRLGRGIETPSNYELRIEWETLDDHVVHFRESEAFAKWKAATGGFLTQPTQVRHVATVSQFF